MTEQPEPRPQIVTWDWKEYAPMGDVGRAIEEVSNDQVHLYEVDTGSDQFAVVVSNKSLTTDEVQGIYKAWRDPDWDVD